LYPNKTGTVHDLIEEAKKQIEVNDDWSGKLRLLEVTSYKINQILPDDVLLECLNPSGSKTYRIEETPKDELRLEAGEFLVPVAHFHKEAYQTFGVPFLLKIKHVCVTSLTLLHVFPSNHFVVCVSILYFSIN